MADDVAIQGEGLETLHLKVLRRKWQILALQITATISLFSMYIMMTRTYGSCDVVDSTSWCPALDHTLTLSSLQQFLVLQPDPLSLPIQKWMTGVGNSGDVRLSLIPI